MLNGEAVGNWSSSLTSSMKLHFKGGRYLFNVVARQATMLGNPSWSTTKCTSPCLVGSFLPLPYLWTPYDPMQGTETKSFQIGLAVLLSGFGLLTMLIGGGFFILKRRQKLREEARRLIEEQAKRRAALERGERYKAE